MRVLLLAFLLSPAFASDSDDRLVRDLLRELIEIDTTHSTGSTGKAAEAMAARLRAAGFAPADVQVLGPRPERANLVFGWIFAGHQLGAGVAAFGAGLSRTLLATYLPAFFVAGALCVVAALIVLAISRPKPAVAAA